MDCCLSGKMPKSIHSVEYQLLKDGSAHSSKLEEDQVSITEEESTHQDIEPTNKSPLWKVAANVFSFLNGSGILALPYVVARTGLVAIAAMLILPFMCYYTGTILIDCLYENNDDGERVRVRSNYKELGSACSPRFGGTIAATNQILTIFNLACLNLVLSASLLTATFPELPLSERVWMVIVAAIGLPAIFVRNLSQVAWLSLISVIALTVAIVAVLAYGVAHYSTWVPSDILVWDINYVPISIVIIIFTYISQPVLPGVEASMQKKSQFCTMLKLTYVFSTILKVGFSVSGFLSFSSNIQDIVVNSLPMGILRGFINGILIISLFFSYPFMVISTIQIIEESVSADSFSFKIPDLVWFIGIRVLINFLTLLPAFAIPHFDLFMAFMGSVTEVSIGLIMPAVFHLFLKKKELKMYHYILDISLIIFGILASITGLVYTGKALIESFSGHSQ